MARDKQGIPTPRATVMVNRKRAMPSLPCGLGGALLLRTLLPLLGEAANPAIFSRSIVSSSVSLPLVVPADDAPGESHPHVPRSQTPPGLEEQRCPWPP